MPNYQYPQGFDPSSSDWGQGGQTPIDDLMSDLGYNTWEDVLTDLDTVDPTDIRPGSFYTPQEAVLMFEEIGIVEYITVFYDPSDGFWHVAVEY